MLLARFTNIAKKSYELLPNLKKSINVKKRQIKA